MKKETFEVFRYRNRKVSNVSVHYHDFFELYFLAKGSAFYQYRVGNNVYLLQPGSIIITRPMELHQPIPARDTEYERIVLRINSDYLHHLSGRGVVLEKCFEHIDIFRSHLIRPEPGTQSRLTHLFNRLISESESSEFGADMYAESILKELMIELGRCTEADFVLPQHPDSPAELISSALDYIDKHYTEQLTLETLAQNLLVSKYYLAHEFKSSVGISLYRFIQLKRLTKAADMLSSGTKPSIAGSACGFNTYSSFYRAFTEEYGVSPSSFPEINS